MLNLKKHSRLILIIVIIFAAMLGIGFLVGQSEEREPLFAQSENIIPIYETKLINDNSVQTIEIDTSRLEIEHSYTLRVVNKDGKTLWETSAGYSHAGWNSVFLTSVGGRDYLMQYNPTTYQGASTYSFRVFSLDREGNEILLDSDEVVFSKNPPGSFSYFRKTDIEPVKAFFEHINQYLAVSELLLNTDDHITSLMPEEQRSRAYGTQDAPIAAPRDYFYESVDLSIDEQMDMFIKMYTGLYGELSN